MKRADNNTLSHAHLIVGPDGIGKSILAKIFALKILRKDKEADYIDIINYSPKKASFGVDDVRNIIEEVSKKPYEGNEKVIIIHEGDKLTIQAQNALLKTIEEPPKGVFIILLSESLELLLDTIKSRCQVYKLTPLNKEHMLSFIKKINITQEESILSALAYAEGIPGRAERILHDENLENLRNLVIKLFNEVINKDINCIVQYEEKFDKFKDEKEEILSVIASFIRDIIIYKELEDKNILINVDKGEDISKLSSALSYKKLNSMLGYVEEARKNFISNVNYSMTMSVMLIGFLEG